MNRVACGSALASVVYLLSPAPTHAGETQTYQYDELGRLIGVDYTGSVNGDQLDTICYDAAGNRTSYKSSAAGSGGCTGSSTPPPPPPPPPPSNNPPTTVNDTGYQAPCDIGYYNVLANDTDPESNYPLALVSVSGAKFSVSSSTQIRYNGTLSHGTTATATYTVRDSLGATATGTLTVTVGQGVCQ